MTDPIFSVTAGAWRVVTASLAGPSHVKRGLPNQDAVAYRMIGNTLIAAVCDGAGSARHAQPGAQLAATTIVAALARQLATSEQPDQHTAEQMRAVAVSAIEETRGNILLEASLLHMAAPEAGPLSLDDFHTTLLAVVASPEGGWMFHVGDGAGATTGTTWDAARLSAPHNAAYANETYFITEPDYQNNLRLTAINEPIRQVLLMTDGVTPFALAHGQQRLAPHFAEPISRYLLTNDQQVGEQALLQTLGSERANAISHDDKTLFWAAFAAMGQGENDDKVDSTGA